jgi:sugar lactone lactonase YvrE
MALALALCGCSAVFAQQYSISTFAGGAPPATPVTGINTSIGQPYNVAADSAGNVYFSSGNAVFKLSPAGSIALFAGNARAGYSGDGGKAVQAQLNTPTGIALDATGDVYIADSLNNVVRMVNLAGIISTVAGNGVPGYSGDGGGATAVDPTFTGMLTNPLGIAVDKQGNLYIADNGNHAIRRVTTDGNINTFAGNQVYSFGYSGDGAAATSAQLDFPTDVAIDSTGNLYIADYGNFVVRQVTTDGNIHTYAGNDVNSFAGDGAAATSASLFQPYGVAVDSSGNLYITEYGDGRVRKVASGSNGAGGKISTIAGNGSFGFAGDGGSATSAQLNTPRGLCVDSSGNVYIADWANNRVRKISGSNISTVAGNGVLSYSGDGGSALQAQLYAPGAVAVDSAGNIYIADTGNHVVRQVTKGVVSTFAGTGTAGFAGDGSAANKAQLNAPQGVAVDSAGNVYIADTGNLRVRVVGTNGNISTFAGTGSPGNGGDNGAAGSATFYLPSAVTTDKAGNVYIADYEVGVVRKVTNGTITTIAGIGASGYSGDGGLAKAAQLNGPSALALDPAGNLYIAQLGDSRVRIVNASGVINTIAGTGGDGYQGEGLPAVSSELAGPTGVAADGNGNVFISVAGNRVMQVLPNGTMSTLVGTGLPGYVDGPAAASMLNIPGGLALDAAGNLYIADSANNAVRIVSPVKPAQ